MWHHTQIHCRWLVRFHYNNRVDYWNQLKLKTNNLFLTQSSSFEIVAKLTLNQVHFSANFTSECTKHWLKLFHLHCSNAIPSTTATMNIAKHPLRAILYVFCFFFYVNSLKILQITCFFGSGYESVHNWGRKQYYNTIANFKICRMKSSFLTPNTPLVDWTAITLIFYAAEIKFWSRGSN